jgi:hypothetical protein
VGGETYGFEVVKDSPADVWLDPARVSARPVALPPAVVAAATSIASALSLRYGAFDFLLRGQVPVFLEVNVTGDWRWLESKTGTAPVTMAVARMLSDLHRDAVVRLGWAPGGAGRGVSLMDFLCGPGDPGGADGPGDGSR